MENPSKSEVIGRSGGDEKNEWPRRTDKIRTPKQKSKKRLELCSLTPTHKGFIQYSFGFGCM